jgi:hypothetical protein
VIIGNLISEILLMNNVRNKRAARVFLAFILGISGCTLISNSQDWEIIKDGDLIHINSGKLELELTWSGKNFTTPRILVEGNQLNKEDIEEFNVVLWKAIPNVEPQGISYSLQTGFEQSNTEKNLTDALEVKCNNNKTAQSVQWTDSLCVSKKAFSNIFGTYEWKLSKPGRGIKHLTLTFIPDSAYKGVSIEINYEIYKRFPAIRKWITFSNSGNEWIKITDLTLLKLNLKNNYSHQTLLTPGSRGFSPSILSFSDSSCSVGIISASEIPSKLRNLSDDGQSGYNSDLFEWILGPTESFESEPVFIYAFAGETYKTISSVSTALDRCVESEFRDFLNRHILRRINNEQEIVPVFCTWTNYNAGINEENMRKAVDIASQIGFRCFQLDAGWSETGPDGGWAVSSPGPNLKKFPELKGFSRFVSLKSMNLGLWYSDFINEQQFLKTDNEQLLYSIPLIKRGGGLGLSMCSTNSRDKYINDLDYLNHTYNSKYFKQDLSNVCYGDIAQGHESRTLKESYLRGLRGLLATQDKLHKQIPDVWLQFSHEIYWETPGPEADVAILKHVDSYHAAPNEYWGAGNRSKLVSPDWKYNVDSLRKRLIEGAFRARNLLYSHRGLPLNRIEVFGAVTTNFKGSLTPEVQDRQVCSWFMGAPISFSGDLSSLTEANIKCYHNGFEIIKNLQKKYKIFSFYQYSGVPSPTDADWHWWGKLNEKGYGAVVVLRGTAGPDSRKINIPWVQPRRKYSVKALLSGQKLGEYEGEQLITGKLEISLNQLSQEIIELSKNN